MCDLRCVTIASYFLDLTLFASAALACDVKQRERSGLVGLRSATILNKTLA